MENKNVVISNKKSRGARFVATDMNISGQCVRCVHRKTGANNWATCDAFPDEIPMHIFVGNVLHNVPIHGDHGIQFEAIKDASQ